MKLRFILFILLSIPIAAFRVWDINTNIDWFTGFSSSDTVIQILGVCCFCSVFLLLPLLKSICIRRGLMASEMKYGLPSRITLSFCVVILFYRTYTDLSLISSYAEFRQVIFITMLLVRFLCCIRYLFIAVSGEVKNKLFNSISGAFPPIYFAMELLIRFMEEISNPYNTTTVISFMASIFLCLSNLRWLQYSTYISERRQRSLLSLCFLCFIVCIAWRLPTAIIYSNPLDLESLLPVLSDALSGVAMLFIAIDAIGDEY